jgi:hypothetical protein
MVTVSLDSIVLNTLMKKGYSLHYYVAFLVYAKECLRELTYDDLQCFNEKLIPINSNNAFQIPNDYVDYVTVGIPLGQGIRPLVEDKKMTSLSNYDSNLNVIPYTSDTASQDDVALILPYNGLSLGNWYTTHMNDYGENIGRFFGSRGGYVDTFKVIPSKNEIQLNEALTGFDYAYVKYLSNGADSGSSTTIDPYAEQTISNYIMWQHKEQNRTYGISERQLAKQEYTNQRQIFRARKSGVTLEVLKRIINRNSYAAPR